MTSEATSTSVMPAKLLSACFKTGAGIQGLPGMIYSRHFLMQHRAVRNEGSASGVTAFQLEI